MKLWEPSTCCCCCKVRTGSILIAVLFLVGGILSFLNGISTLAWSGDSNEEFCQRSTNPGECKEQIEKIELGSGITSMVISCFHIIFSSLLLHGILKQKTAFFVPLMIAYIIHISIMILFSILVLLALLYLEVAFGGVILAAASLGLGVFMETYFLLVIRAHYLEIKRAKGHIHTALKDRDTEIPPYPTSQVPPYPTSQVPPYPTSQVPPYPTSQVPPYPTSQVPPYPTSQVPPYPGNEVPPYPGNEVPSYPESNVPLYPNMEKNFN